MAGAVPFAVSAWTQTKSVPIGIELYSVRNELMKDLNGTVTAVAKLGYEVVEFYSPYFEWSVDQAKSVRKLLDDVERVPGRHGGRHRQPLQPDGEHHDGHHAARVEQELHAEEEGRVEQEEHGARDDAHARSWGPRAGDLASADRSHPRPSRR